MAFINICDVIPERNQATKNTRVLDPQLWLTKKQADFSGTGVTRPCQRLASRCSAARRPSRAIFWRASAAPWHPGQNVGIGKDHTLFAPTEGRVTFNTKAKGRVFISVLPAMEAAAE